MKHNISIPIIMAGIAASAFAIGFSVGRKKSPTPEYLGVMFIEKSGINSQTVTIKFDIPIEEVAKSQYAVMKVVKK